ncbi:DEAD/DEAH box helicase [Pseudogracilibacillus sp. ICA-222130]|uniref:DEAD/DEAH box helicase n=1 Tax=Pseudogracilibacillus sp. ICA-222130 TaxID=3134655 RepID=UPI0030BBC129
MGQKLTHTNIQQLFSPKIYERGLQYYHLGRVHGLSFNKNSDAWFAEVEGTSSYYVEVDMNHIDQGTIKPYCECPNFAVYHTCKHIVAVLLEISDQEKEAIKAMNRATAEHFIQNVSQYELHDTSYVLNKIPMKIAYEINVEYTGKIWLQIKTGTDHLYVVHQIRDLLYHALHGEEHFFTKKFSFRPEDHYFLQQDMAIFELLQSSIQTGDVYTDRRYDPGNAYDRRHLLLSPSNLQLLLEKLQKRTVYLTGSNDKEVYTSVQIETDKLPLQFSVKDYKDNLALYVEGNEETPIYDLTMYNALYQGGTFYFLGPLQRNLLHEFGRVEKRSFVMPIPSSLKDTFFSETLPKIRQITPVEMNESIQDDIVEAPLIAKLYLEMDGEKITGKLEYHYGAHKIDPFQHTKKKQQKIIIRDMEKEEQIMHFIEQSNFKYNGETLFIQLYEDEEVYEFLYTILPQLDEYVEVYLTADIQAMMAEVEPIPNSAVRIDETTNLLEISFDISGVEEAEVTAMLQAVMEKKRFYRMRNGTIVSLENEQFASIQNLVSTLDIKDSQLHDGKMEIPAYHSMQVDELLDLKKSYDPSFRKLLQQLRSPEQTSYEVPDRLNATLRAYQEAGYQWFKSLSEYRLGGILADDMGLGKTIQTITYLMSEHSENPHLVIVPSSVVYNWKHECTKFAPHLDVAVISGTRQERATLMDLHEQANVWVMSYGTARQDIELLKGRFFHTLILDEAQFIKNYETKTAKAIREINARNCFALSGTPIENSIDELWSIFQVVLPGLMPNLKTFRELPNEKIASLTRPFILRRVKEDVLKELPDKIETTSISELTEEQKHLYVGYLQQVQRDAQDSIVGESFQKNRMKILAGITRLRQLCCHPALFLENYEGTSGKLERLLEMIEQSIADNKRMLIFSQFTSMHDIIRKELEKRHIKYFYIHGETPAKKRVEMSEAFNEGENSVFLISLRAGGTGLNLTGADTVILYDLWWNPAVEDQAAGRAHRFGQKNVVQVIRLIAEGTIEEKIYELQQKKRELIDQVIQPGESMLSTLSEEDIKQLLSI